MVSDEPEETDRDDQGRFRKGVSGNPKGRPKSILRRRLREACEWRDGDTEETRADRVIRITFGLIFDEETPPQTRLGAIQWLTDQVDGKLPATAHVEGNHEGVTIQFVQKPEPGADS